MRYLKAFKVFESIDTDDLINGFIESKNRVGEKVKSATGNLPVFIEKISELIETNYELYDIDDELLENIIDKHLIGKNYKDKQIKIEFKEKFANPKTNIEMVVALIVNFGYSVGRFAGGNGNTPQVRFSEFIDEVVTGLHFDRNSRHGLSYDGPDILSSSILASSFNIKQQVKEIEDGVRRYYNNDKEFGELKILIGCIYQYGYGLGHDAEYYEIVNKNIKMLNSLRDREKKKD